MYAKAIAAATLMCFPVATLAQNHAPVVEAASQQHELEQLNARWLKAYERRDRKALEEILADDFVGNYFGRALSKAQLVSSTTDPNRHVKEVTWKDLQIRSNATIAVVSGISTLRVVQGDAPEAVSTSHYIDVYERRNGRWQAIAAHVSPAPK